MIIVVLPAYNEASCIGALLESFLEVVDESLPCRFIVVNDGSSDETVSIVQSFAGRLEIHLISHTTNRGLAEAMKTGFARVVETAAENDIVVTMDSDNSHLPGLMYRMVQLIKEGHDIVIASRYRCGAWTVGLSRFRRMMSYGASLLFRSIMPIRGVRDYTCGYRAYRASVIKRAFVDYGSQFISESGFSCMVDILLKLRRYDLIITEVPLILRYDQKLSSSKMDVRKTIIQTLTLLAKRRLSSK